MLSVTNQMVRTLQRDNSNKFDSQQSHPAQGHQRAETENDSEFSQKEISNGFCKKYDTSNKLTRSDSKQDNKAEGQAPKLKKRITS